MKPRIKMHQLPGDISKQEKAKMLEGKHPNKKRAKSFRKRVYARMRAVLKARTMKEVKRELEGSAK